jgi:hypothetical protein
MWDGWGEESRESRRGRVEAREGRSRRRRRKRAKVKEYVVCVIDFKEKKVSLSLDEKTAAQAEERIASLSLWLSLALFGSKGRNRQELDAKRDVGEK